MVAVVSMFRQEYHQGTGLANTSTVLFHTDAKHQAVWHMQGVGHP